MLKIQGISIIVVLGDLVLALEGIRLVFDNNPFGKAFPSIVVFAAPEYKIGRVEEGK